jgi:hypothetical protein
MMKKASFAAALFAFALLVAAPLANATTVSEVQTMVASLKAKTTGVAISGKQAESKDRPGLTAKLDEAALKVDQAKFCDAIQKLNDFKVKVNQLIAAGKINQDPTLGTTGQELLTDADGAINGIRELATQSGTTCAF